MTTQLFKTKEELLNAIRNGNNSNSKGSTDTSQTVRRTIQNGTEHGVGNDATSREEASDGDGRIGSDESSERSTSRTVDGFTRENIISARRDSSINQYDRPDRGRGNGYTTYIGNTVKGLKSAFKPFEEAFKNDKPAEKKPGKKSVGKTLSDAEALKLRPKLVEMLKWQSEHLDQFIIATTKGHEYVEIWSNIDDDECEILADFLLSRGKANVQTAQLVRNLSVLMEKIKIGLIALPRVYKTFKVYMERGFSIK